MHGTITVRFWGGPLKDERRTLPALRDYDRPDVDYPESIHINSAPHPFATGATVCTYLKTHDWCDRGQSRIYKIDPATWVSPNGSCGQHNGPVLWPPT